MLLPTSPNGLPPTLRTASSHSLVAQLHLTLVSPSRHLGREQCRQYRKQSPLVVDHAKPMRLPHNLISYNLSDIKSKQFPNAPLLQSPGDWNPKCEQGSMAYLPGKLTMQSVAERLTLPGKATLWPLEPIIHDNSPKAITSSSGPMTPPITWAALC